MPIHEYECHKCKHIFELRQDGYELNLAKCPKCGAWAKCLMSIVNHKKVIEGI